MDCFAIVVAGGSGTRMQSRVRKQYLDLGGKPVLTRSLMPFCADPTIRHTVVVVPEEDFQTCRDTVITPYGLGAFTSLVAGGSERQASVLNGLTVIAQSAGRPEETLVLIHDGVRPFVKGALIHACIGVARDRGACVPVVAVKDTLKRVGADQCITGTVDRQGLFHAQTPQVFRLDLILEAHARALAEGRVATDDASLLECLGFAVATVPGSSSNIKITTKEDLALAEFFLTSDTRPGSAM